MTGRRAATWALSAAALLVAASCRQPTAVEIEARTNVAFRDGLVVSFMVGAPGETEGGEATTEERGPWGGDGFVGSLAVVPRTSDSAALSVRIVLGVDRDSRSCTPPAYAGCIVARRRLHYSPHERLRLPITLYAQCKDVVCSAESTCNILGQCVSAEVDLGTCGTAAGCTTAGDPQPEGPVTPVDASFDGTSSGGDAAGDASAEAAGDASLDSGKDAPVPPSEGTPGKIDCNPVTCNAAASEQCCYDSNNPGTGFCVTPGMGCISGAGHFTYRCDGDEDCAPGLSCCGTASDSFCKAMGCNPVDQICHSTKQCAGNRLCAPAMAGLYEVCR